MISILELREAPKILAVVWNRDLGSTLSHFTKPWLKMFICAPVSATACLSWMRNPPWRALSSAASPPCKPQGPPTAKR